MPEPPHHLLRILLAVLLLPLIALTLQGADPALFAHQMNLGKAYLENRNSAGAIEAFSAAVQAGPTSPQALRNLARAQILAKAEDAALKTLEQAATLEKGSPAVSYLSGLAHAHQSRFKEAVPFFEEAVRLDPHTPALRFQLGNAYQLTLQNDKALQQFLETVRLDPLHASAQFKLSTFAIRRGDRAEYDRRNQEFSRLRKVFGDDARTPEALERCLHTLAEPVPPPPPQRTPAIPVSFTDSTESSLPNPATRHAIVAGVIEVNTNSQPELFCIAADGTLALLRLTPEGAFSRTEAGKCLENLTDLNTCVIANFHDDTPPGKKYDPALHARNDVFLLAPAGSRLLKRTEENRLIDITEPSGLGPAGGSHATALDYDHDGDVDLLIATGGGARLWQNNGNGTFTNVTAGVGVVSGENAAAVHAAELDGNGAVDFLAAHGDTPTHVFINQRAGRYALRPDPPGPLPAAQEILADDLDNDGHVDLVLINAGGCLILYGGRSQRIELSIPKAARGALVDFDNDGWLDLALAAADGTLHLWRNDGTPSFTDVTRTCELGSIPASPLRQILPVDFDLDGDSDLLLVTSAGGLRFIRNEGGNRNRQLKLTLLGGKTNPMGIGTRIEVRAGAFRVSRWVRQLPVEIGLQQLDRIDSLRATWTNGIEDNQVNLPWHSNLLQVIEKNVAAGSCPYLYAWDGSGFRFVTDLLGNAPIGLSLRRDVMLPADPEEIVLIGNHARFPARDGAYELELTDELREVFYLDHTRLIAVDHDPSIEIHSNDKLGPGPYPPSDLWALQHPRVPTRAWGDDGIDRTGAVAREDAVYAPPGTPLPPPLRGICEPLKLTLEFGALPVEKPLVLALTGWIQYGDASVNIAASQRHDLAIIPPMLEAQDGTGTWHALDVVVGMPAGKTKTIMCDLAGKLPPGCGTLRLSTTFELRWDRIALFERASTTPARHSLSPRSARLYWRGFSGIQPRGPGHPFTPAYADLSERPPWANTPEGWCTRYGDVLPLVNSRDDRLAILNGGDALNLRFDATLLPTVPEGLTRTFFLYSVGWDKDEDYNVVAGNTVEPLPVKATGDWPLEYNTRWVPADRFRSEVGAAGVQPAGSAPGFP